MEALAAWFDAIVQWLVAFVEHLGVLGIFIMTFLESTFMPIPSEITMIPAGYLVQQGKLPLLGTLIASIIGTIGGAYFNYWIARHFGRGLFLRYGKYFLMTPEKLLKLERFFARHGAVSTFIGRLIPGIRHYISFPAGLAQMDRRTFLLYTALGGALWMSTLIALGYYIGQNKALMVTYLPMIKGGIFLFVLVLLAVYTWHCKRRARRNGSL
ncbi:MAG: DedA family protein [Alphaproteobacteria bacterium]|nr:DedA family protein [Alphaproteobacteria bacterium]